MKAIWMIKRKNFKGRLLCTELFAHFDEESERYIKEVWKELSDQAISTYAEEVIDRRPHITLASYQRLNMDRFLPLFNLVMNRVLSYRLH